MSDPKKLDKSVEIRQKLAKFMEENEFEIVPTMHFPMYNKLPVELELALAVIQKHEPQFDIQIELKKEDKVS